MSLSRYVLGEDMNVHTAVAHAQTPAPAAAVRSERNVSLELALQIAQAGVAACQAGGYAVTTTVVDRAGGVRAVARAEGELGRRREWMLKLRHARCLPRS